MEPIKLENQIKEKLNSREIQPSAKAWDRLDAMLAVAEEKKAKRSFGWLYIAASILVLVALGTFLFTQKNIVINPHVNIVGTEIKKDSVKKSDYKIQVPILKQKQESRVAVIKENKSSITNLHTPIINQRVSINNQQITNNKNPAIKYDQTIEYQNSSDIALKDLPRIVNQKTVVAKNDDSKKLDEFLLEALDNTAKHTTAKKATMKIDAKSLLSQVDGELELTFREKIINRVSKDYKEVKVALANRNNE